MPEYLSPGVYVEEVSFRSKSIEGVPTSTTGFAGLTRTGPVQYVVTGSGLRGPDVTEPRLITSFTEFERVYGGLDPMTVDGDERIPFLGHAARAFFMNGGSRLYVSRVFSATDEATDTGLGHRHAPRPGQLARRRPRPSGGRAGRARSATCSSPSPPGAARRRVRRHRHDPGQGAATAGALVEVIPAGRSASGRRGRRSTPRSCGWSASTPTTGQQTFTDHDGNTPGLANDDRLLPVALQVTVSAEDGRIDVYNDLGAHPLDRRYIGKILQKNRPEDENAIVWLDYGDYDPQDLAHREFQDANASGIDLAVALQQNTTPRLEHGADGTMPTPDALEGLPADLDHPEVKATGLFALEEVEDIAIVALPDGEHLRGRRGQLLRRRRRR